MESLPKRAEKTKSAGATIKSKRARQKRLRKATGHHGRVQDAYQCQIAEDRRSSQRYVQPYPTWGKYQLVRGHAWIWVLYLRWRRALPYRGDFSGGEIDLANLVLRIAISKTLGELSGGGNIRIFGIWRGVWLTRRRTTLPYHGGVSHLSSESYRQIFWFLMRRRSKRCLRGLWSCEIIGRILKT